VEIIHSFSACHLFFFSIALCHILPLTKHAVWKFKFILAANSQLSVIQASRIILQLAKISKKIDHCKFTSKTNLQFTFANRPYSSFSSCHQECWSSVFPASDSVHTGTIALVLQYIQNVSPSLDCEDMALYSLELSYPHFARCCLHLQGISEAESHGDTRFTEFWNFG
jgi:hypothetical protein